MNAEKNMTPRLLAISACVTPGSRIADIGTDHAYIPIYLLQKEMIPCALAMDINVGPIRRAQENIRRFQMEERIATRLSDGLLELSPGEVDEAIIAGMGGILICEILQARKDLWADDLRFILQPMTASEELRKFLEKNGFCIEKETLAKEEEKIYQILCVRRGEMRMKREADYYINPYLIENKVPWTMELLNRRISEFEKMLPGLSKSSRHDAVQKYRYVQMLLKELYDVRGECGNG